LLALGIIGFATQLFTSTRQLLPQVQADYEAGKAVYFSDIIITQQTIRYREKAVALERVSRVEFVLERRVIEKDGIHAEWLTVPLAEITNVCVLEALLENIQPEKGFTLSLALGERAQGSVSSEPFATKRLVRYPRKTSWISTMILVILTLLVIGVEISGVIASFRSSQSPAVKVYYPAPNSYSMHPTPFPGLPYSAESV
jgi:hypothetical protein